jgi:D-methionine transport system substrate-binding protein
VAAQPQHHQTTRNIEGKPTMKRFHAIAALAAASALTLAACSSGGSGAASESSSAAATQAAGDLTTIVVGASPVPHAQILQFVQDNLAKDAGLNIEIKEYQDYVQPNVALEDQSIDANYFQHVPYLEEEIASKGYTFDHGEGIHIEPYGIYSQKITSLDDLPDGAVIGITNDPSNQARALDLLQQNGIITVDDSVENPTIYDIKDNPKNVTFQEAEAPAVAALLPDVDIAIINGNYALESGLTPSKDALYLESGKDNPYANVLVWNTEEDASKIAAVKKLDELLHSDAVSEYIKQTWPDGEVQPAF